MSGRFRHAPPPILSAKDTDHGQERGEPVHTQRQSFLRVFYTHTSCADFELSHTQNILTQNSSSFQPQRSNRLAYPWLRSLGFSHKQFKKKSHSMHAIRSSRLTTHDSYLENDGFYAGLDKFWLR